MIAKLKSHVLVRSKYLSLNHGGVDQSGKVLPPILIPDSGLSGRSFDLSG